MSRPVTATARPPLPARTPAALPRGPSLWRVVSAEWTKMTSLRSRAALAATTVAVSGALAYLDASASSTDPGFDPLSSLVTGLPLAQVGPLILGVLVGTGEFSTGTFRSTFTAVPRRLPVLAAQTIVTAGFAWLTSVLAVGAALLGVLPAARSRGIALDLIGDGAPQLLAGMVAYFVGISLLGLAIGTLVRRPFPAVATAVVLVLILPFTLIVGFLSAAIEPTPGPAQPNAIAAVVTLLPSGAGMLLIPQDDVNDGAPDLGVRGGAVVFAAWMCVSLAASAVLLRSRDLS